MSNLLYPVLLLFLLCKPPAKATNHIAGKEGGYEGAPLKNRYLPTRIHYSPVQPTDSMQLLYVQAFGNKGIPIISEEAFGDLIKLKAKETIDLMKQGEAPIGALERQTDFANVINLNFNTGGNDSSYFSLKWNVIYYPVRPQNKMGVPYIFFYIDKPKPFKDIIYQLVDSIAASGLLK